MNQRKPAAASIPPAGITGLNPVWSRLVTAPDSENKDRTWHLLDSWSQRLTDEQAPVLTLLCVHGNPSWSFLWRHVLAQAQNSIRVIAVDQLDMGYSERTGVKRTLAMRVRDLIQLTKTLELAGPVVTVAHDWGGPVSLGWGLEHYADSLPTAPDNELTKAYLAGVVLTNTAVHQPKAASAPAVIRFIRSPGVLKLLTVNTRAFISGAIKMSKPALPQSVSDGFHAPYRHKSRRAAIADFVADIPLENAHESAATLNAIAASLGSLSETPALLLWGPRDRVFSDLYLDDLEARLPHADVHRYPLAAHFVTEDADVAGALIAWLSHRFCLDTSNQHSDMAGFGADSDARKSADVACANADAVDSAPDTAHSVATFRPLSDFSDAGSSTIAVVEQTSEKRSISFGDLTTKVQALASGMAAYGIAPGTRVAVMIMPGVDLSIVVYACWRLGATLVLVDSGLGKNGMQRALQSARPDYLIGIDKALVAARLLGWPGKRISVRPFSTGKLRILGTVTDLESLYKLGNSNDPPPWPKPDTVAAVVFTSGSTGPSKGVVYQHRQIAAQRESLMRIYDISCNDKLVAAFAPFALYGPTMCITSMVPDMDVSKPGTLSAEALVKAIETINATLVFASPAALVNVVATQQNLAPETMTVRSAVRLTLSAGAPVRASLLDAVGSVFPNASLHTPYGMTEVLPVADISLAELNQAVNVDNSSGTLIDSSADETNAVPPSALQSAGVCVGFPLENARITIDPLDDMGKPLGSPTNAHGILGEIVVQADHIRYGYDRLWATQHLASRPAGVHRTGDVGQLDANGRLWVGGRLGHVVLTSHGPVAPVGCEQMLETIDGVNMAALVGVGPAGTQAVVAVVQAKPDFYPVGIAPLELVDKVRHAVRSIVDIAAVLVVKHLPVDRRHNSKVDRTAVAHWAAAVLAGDTRRTL